MKKAYVTALVERILAGQAVETSLMNLRALMEKRGHLRLFSQVLKAAMRELEVKLKRVVPQVTLAKAGGVSEEAIKAALAELGAAAEAYDTTIDSSLVRGFSARVRGRLLDKSYKRVLLNFYEKITK
jgi:F0F1-type ATP synthase delta subunit